MYLADAARFIVNLSVPDAEEFSELTITGEVYGGCRNACPSFQVQADGSYRYLYTPEAGAAQVIRQGDLPVRLRNNLKDVLTPTALEKQSTVIEPLVCNSYSDGIDVQYDITLNGRDYFIDSCGTNVDGAGVLWKTLGSIWTYFELTGGNN